MTAFGILRISLWRLKFVDNIFSRTTKRKNYSTPCQMFLIGGGCGAAILKISPKSTVILFRHFYSNCSRSYNKQRSSELACMQWL